MAKSPAPTSLSSRPSNAVFLALFGLLTLGGAWFMRFEAALSGLPIDLVQNVERGILATGLPLKAKYTGLGPLDAFLTTLVSAFAGGAAGLRSRRPGAADPLPHSVYYVILWMLGCQTIGGAVIIPLYCLSYIFASRNDAYFRSGREVALPYAKAILPAALLGYLVPTIAMYWPWDDIVLTQNLTAFWQPAPLLVNVLMWILAFLFGVTSPAKEEAKGSPPDLKHLNRIYLFAGLVSALNHIGTLLICITSSNPQLSLRYVFFPDSSIRLSSTTLGLHYIFQCDEWWSFAPSLVWCWVAAYDVQRLRDQSSAFEMLRAFWRIAGGAVVLGPGATMAAVWYWREEMLVLLESEGKMKSG